MNTLYKDILLDHYRAPRNKGILDSADFACKEYIPSCGDAISLQGTVKNNRIEKVMFEGVGCVISQATASLVTQRVQGMALDAVLALTAADIQSMIGMQLGPLRMKCALLALHVLQAGLRQYQGK